jgi:hypothetical protein
MLSALFQAVAHLPPIDSLLLLQALFNAVLWGELSHPPTLDGVVYLKFSQAPATPLFSGVESYQLVSIAGLVYLEFTRGTVLHPLSSRVSHTSTTVASLVHSKFTGGSCQTISGRLVYLKFAQVPAFLLSPELKAPRAFCYVSFSVPYFLFFFFPQGRGSDCPVGYAGLSQGWLWGYCMPLICSPVGLHLPNWHLATWEPS